MSKGKKSIQGGCHSKQKTFESDVPRGTYIYGFQVPSSQSRAPFLIFQKKLQVATGREMGCHSNLMIFTAVNFSQKMLTYA